MADGTETLGQRLQRERAEQAAALEAPEKKSAWQKFKDKFVATPEDMNKMTENRADVQNRKEMSIGANPAVNKIDLVQGNATGLKEPISNVTTEQAMSGDTPDPVKLEGGSALGDLVDTGAVDDTFASGALGGTKDGVTLTTEQKREAEGLNPEKGESDGNNNNAGSIDNTDNSNQEDIAEDSAMKQWQIAQKVLDEQNPYKSGADYLQALWGKGAKGKAQAIANVLGNILGATGKGVAGQDYQSDWARFRDEYTKQSQERRAEAAKNAQDMVNTVAQNKQARAELANALAQAKANGANISTEDMAAIQAWQTATQPSSALNKAIAALVTSVQNEGLLGTAGNIIAGLGGKK